MKLGDLRKKHYDLGGTNDEILEDKLPSKPEVSRKPPLSQKPNIPPKKDSQASVIRSNFYYYC